MAVEYVCEAVATCTCILWLFIDVIHVHVHHKEGDLIRDNISQLYYRLVHHNLLFWFLCTWWENFALLRFKTDMI